MEMEEEDLRPWWRELCFPLLSFPSLCFALLCFALLSFPLLCFPLLCFALHCFAFFCFALLSVAFLCFALLSYAFILLSYAVSLCKALSRQTSELMFQDLVNFPPLHTHERTGIVDIAQLTIHSFIHSSSNMSAIGPLGTYQRRAAWAGLR